MTRFVTKEHGVEVIRTHECSLPLYDMFHVLFYMNDANEKVSGVVIGYSVEVFQDERADDVYQEVKYYLHNMDQIVEDDVVEYIDDPETGRLTLMEEEGV